MSNVLNTSSSINQSLTSTLILDAATSSKHSSADSFLGRVTVKDTVPNKLNIIETTLASSQEIERNAAEAQPSLKAEDFSSIQGLELNISSEELAVIAKEKGIEGAIEHISNILNETTSKEQLDFLGETAIKDAEKLLEQHKDNTYAKVLSELLSLMKAFVGYGAGASIAIAVIWLLLSISGNPIPWAFAGIKLSGMFTQSALLGPLCKAVGLGLYNLAVTMVTCPTIGLTLQGLSYFPTLTYASAALVGQYAERSICYAASTAWNWGSWGYNRIKQQFSGFSPFNGLAGAAIAA